MENQRLSPHFNLADFLASNTAVRLGIGNEPHDPEVVIRLRLLAEKLLEPVQERFNTRPQITSGYRCPALNTQVGGVATSQHLTGQAVDFQLPGTSLLEVAGFMAATLDFDQLLLEQAKGEIWIHASYVSAGSNRRIVKWYDGESWHDGLPESLPQTPSGQLARDDAFVPRQKS